MVAIPFLIEFELTKRALEGALTQVQAYVLLHVVQSISAMIETDQALKLLSPVLGGLIECILFADVYLNLLRLPRLLL